MKFRTALMALAACGISFSSLADVKLDLPYQADLVLVNGVEQDGNDTLTLPNGVNQFAFTYIDSLRENGDDYLYKSDVIIVKFDASDEALKLELPNFVPLKTLVSSTNHHSFLWLQPTARRLPSSKTS